MNGLRAMTKLRQFGRRFGLRMPQWNSFLKATAISLLGITVVVILWKGPQWQVSHYQGLDSKAWFAQVNEARKTLAQILGGAFVLFGLYLSLETFILSSEGQITDRFSKAIEQLGTPGDDKLEVRLGGIYSLERIARDSKRDHPVVMEVLTAFVREHAKAKDPAAVSGVATDVQSILTVLGRRELSYDREEPDLHGTTLMGAYLFGAHFEGVNLLRANLEGANLWGAHLEGANLWGARLNGAILQLAHLESAFLIGAHFEGAFLHDAHLEGAILQRAHLEGASLWDAHLEGADLRGANLAGAQNLTQEQVDSAYGSEETKLPPGLKMPESWLKKSSG